LLYLKNIPNCIVASSKKVSQNYLNNYDSSLYLKIKTISLNQFTVITGYNRTYAARILRLKAEKVIEYARLNNLGL